MRARVREREQRESEGGGRGGREEGRGEEGGREGGRVSGGRGLRARARPAAAPLTREGEQVQSIVADVAMMAATKRSAAHEIEHDVAV